MTAPTIAACLIVRDGAATLERCLASLRPHVDEVCILDTGSTDDTLSLLEALGREPGPPIRVKREPWGDDFAAAREASFAMASTEYVSWWDDDEVLEGGEHIRPILEDTLADVLLLRRVEMWWSDEVTYDFRYRVTRRGVGRWVSPVHERLEFADDAELRFEAVEPDAVRVLHLPAPVRGRHDHRAHVRRALASAPTRHLAFYEARHLLLDDGDYAAAREAFAAVLAAHEEEPLERDRAEHAQAWACLAACRAHLGDHEGARDALRARDDVAAAGRRDPLTRRLHRLDRAFRIPSDDPLWAIAEARALLSADTEESA